MENALSMNQSSGNIINIPRERLDKAVEVLALAFEHDPAIQYLFSSVNQPGAFRYQLRELYHYVCMVRFELQLPLLGCVVDNQLVGVACVAELVAKPMTDHLIKMYERLKSVFGPETTSRLEAYAQLTDQFRPKQPHFYLRVIGVHPEAQGKGYGRILLEAVHELSEAHPTSTGVALDTENADNVPFYQHCGYALIAKTKLEQLAIWCMFRPNGTQK